VAASEPIIVVSGLPRSGTSLMMRLLEAASVPVLQDATRPPDESNPRGYYELAAVRATARDARWVERAPGHAVKVIHRLLAALPRDRDYRVIVMRRPVREVVASQDRMLARLGAPGSGRPGDPDSGRPGDPATGLPSARLEAVLAAQLEEAMALLDREPCFTWMGVDVHALIDDPEAEIARVLDFLGLAARPARLARLVEPALLRERS
jgi:hypothetical protein